MRKLLTALALTAALTAVSASAEEASPLKTNSKGLVEAMEAVEDSLPTLVETGNKIAAIQAAFEQIEQCREERGSWHCKELTAELMAEIKEKYGE